MSSRLAVHSACSLQGQGRLPQPPKLYFARIKNEWAIGKKWILSEISFVLTSVIRNSSHCQRRQRVHQHWYIVPVNCTVCSICSSYYHQTRQQADNVHRRIMLHFLHHGIHSSDAKLALLCQCHPRTRWSLIVDCAGSCFGVELKRGDYDAKLVTILDTLHAGQFWWEFICLLQVGKWHRHQSNGSKCRCFHPRSLHIGRQFSFLLYSTNRWAKCGKPVVAWKDEINV